ncbi:hypothetical protein MFIFM68171_04721 [Madurella fahalii]|uniref:Uncharacterized protein n=1 Tax=Madurella fahalii TaxID=1157608 RepID=A0ABQ0G9V2_9PEZI
MPPGTIAPFKAVATQYRDMELHIYANMLNGLTGGVIWQAGTSSTSASVRNKYVWGVDSEGYLKVANPIPPYSYEYVAYFTTTMSGSRWLQVNTRQSVENAIANGGSISKVKACADSVTGELMLDAAGRKNILWCGSQLWMSAGDGSDINRGECSQIFPKAVAA